MNFIENVSVFDGVKILSDQRSNEEFHRRGEPVVFGAPLVPDPALCPPDFGELGLNGGGAGGRIFAEGPEFWPPFR